MAHFVMSAFADEAATDLDGQIEALMEEDISMIELRGVDGVNCADLSKEDAARIHKKLKEHHISLSALGSPYGKISITDDFEEHLDKFKRSLEVCDILECSRIRMFSFYMPEGEKPEKYRDEVMNRLEKMVDMAQKSGILLVHENEKGIYGDNDIRCKELYNYFGGRMGVCFDPANYVQCKVDPMEAYRRQKDTITYFHMKDALKENGSVVSVGHGDGSVPEILKDIKDSGRKEVILTIEPHLHVFKGLDALQGETVQHVESYTDSRTAFHAACEALRNCLKILEK